MGGIKGIAHPNKKGTYIATLECESIITGERHTVTFRTSPPFAGDPVWCAACQRYSVVMLAPYVWEGECQDCAYSGTPHLDRTRARTIARGHGRTHPGHAVALTHYGEVVEVWKDGTNLVPQDS